MLYGSSRENENIIIMIIKINNNLSHILHIERTKNTMEYIGSIPPVFDNEKLEEVFVDDFLIYEDGLQ